MGQVVQGQSHAQRVTKKAGTENKKRSRTYLVREVYRMTVFASGDNIITS